MASKAMYHYFSFSEPYCVINHAKDKDIQTFLKVLTKKAEIFIQPVSDYMNKEMPWKYR